MKTNVFKTGINFPFAKSKISAVAIGLGMCLWSNYSIASDNASFGIKYPKGFNPELDLKLGFKENKGQVHDQNYKSRPDVLYSGTDGVMTYHLKNDGISYQLNRIVTWKKLDHQNKKSKTDATSKIPDQSTIYRMDIKWLNTNKHSSIENGVEQGEVTNYYLENCPNGILDVKQYNQVTYKQIYKGIDLKWYHKEGHLKYDYNVAAGADYKQIQFQFEGAQKIKLNDKGDLVLKTPLGEIIEQAPLVMQEGKILKSAWLINEDYVSFDIKNINPEKSFVIDPVVASRSWGTYYGGTVKDEGYSCATNSTGNVVYIAGLANSTLPSEVIATTGSFQATKAGSVDAFLAKFTSSGTRSWATYYGGAGTDIGYSCTVDPSGNVYLAGQTSSSNTASEYIATSTAYDNTYGGGGLPDAFLVKFNSGGVRQWGTYFGGTSNDYGFSCTADALGNVYLSGETRSTSLCSGGAYTTYGGGFNDGYLAKFNSAGTFQWSTYYGGLSNDYALSCATDALNNVFLTGGTSSSNRIATAGAHDQINNAGDAFLVKFNSAGTVQWGTYYGGTGSDDGKACVVDGSGNVYVAGKTNSSNTGNVIATLNQIVLGGGTDVFLVKFDGAGSRLWATYFGGSGNEGAVLHGGGCSIDANNNVYISGETNSSNGIATVGTYDATYGGNTDAFLARFNASGVLLWGTYYGGADIDQGWACATSAVGPIYLIGYTTGSSTSISTSLSHQAVYGGGSGASSGDAFLVKFCQAPELPGAITGPTSICPGTSNTYCVPTIPDATSYNWTLPNGQIFATTTNCITTSLITTNGNLSVYASNNCGITKVKNLAITMLVCRLGSSQSADVLSNGISKENGVSIFPNPNSGDRFTVSLNELSNETKTIEMDLYNVFGQKLQSASFINQGDEQINTEFKFKETYAEGIYFVNISIDGRLVSKKRISIIK